MPVPAFNQCWIAVGDQPNWETGLSSGQIWGVVLQHKPALDEFRDRLAVVSGEPDAEPEQDLLLRDPRVAALEPVPAGDEPSLHDRTQELWRRIPRSVPTRRKTDYYKLETALGLM